VRRVMLAVLAVLAFSSPVLADVYYAYQVRTTVFKFVRMEPRGPVYQPVVLVSGWMDFTEAVALAREIRREGVCNVVEQTLEAPGSAECYPVHLVQKVQVISPSNSEAGLRRR
jgi:hypothetical protein